MKNLIHMLDANDLMALDINSAILAEYQSEVEDAMTCTSTYTVYNPITKHILAFNRDLFMVVKRVMERFFPGENAHKHAFNVCCTTLDTDVPFQMWWLEDYITYVQKFR